MKKFRSYWLLLILMLMACNDASAAADGQAVAQEELNIRELILEHLADAYEWRITSFGKTDISIPLPVILHSRQSGWHVFMSSRLHGGQRTYNGFQIPQEGKFKGKIVETDRSGHEIRPLDLSLTKNALSLIMASTLLILLIISVARSLKRNPIKARKGFTGAMEMFIVSVNDDVIKPSIGEGYEKYAPYLLTVFFFIFINNLLGLIPMFPGGANVTGNIAVTLVLATVTFLIVQFSGTKEYYREIFWPDVPTWLKVPIPLMPVIEIVGVFTKPFALMIRLFANILAGHAIVLGLTSLVFVTVSMGVVMNTSMTLVSVLLTVFIDLVELLVAYIQAYVFTLLSAVFIGLSRLKPHEKKLETKTDILNK
ncbi:MAG: F0F1 ATP synthase subunit A [Petrimonas sp.]|nr:F0F1 ATP synthase subunit A [Petrimonas sp.]